MTTSNKNGDRIAMNFLPIRLIAIILFVLMLAPQVSGSNEFPLAPPKTSSPRETLESFLVWSKVFHNAMRAPIEDPAEIQDALDRAARCFDLSEIPPTLVSNVGVESVLRLREILDRIPLPEISEERRVGKECLRLCCAGVSANN